MLKKAVKIANAIVPPNGKITYKTINDKDAPFFAQIHLSNIDGHFIEFNEHTINKYFEEEKLDELHQLLFLCQIAIHENVHSLTFNVIKTKDQQEFVSELAEQIFKNLISNIHLINV